jgi:PAS domain S-box-containing protein
MSGLLDGGGGFDWAGMQDGGAEPAGPSSWERQEAWLALAVEAGHLSTWEVDVATDRLTWGHLSRSLAWLPHEATSRGADLFALVHPDDREALLRGLRTALVTGGSIEAELRVIGPRGDLRWLTGRACVLPGAPARGARILGVVRDVTDGHGAAARAADGGTGARAPGRVDARFRQIFDANVVGILFCDDGGVVHEANDAALRLLGTARERLGERAWQWTDPATDGAPHDARTLAELCAGRTSALHEKDCVRPDGTRAPVLVGAARMAPAGIVAFLLDASEQRRAARERERHVEELDRAVRFSETVIGILGHDLRNPLSAISTTAEWLLRREVGGSLSGPLSRIVTSADRMRRMVDQLLDFTTIRFGGGHLPLQPASTDLARVVHLVLQEEAAQGSADITLTVTGDPVGTWDPDRMAQLLSNLVGNAVQHRTPGTPVHIEIDGVDPARLVLAVHNRGVVPPQVQPHIFEPFGSRHGKRRGRSSGLGLGLFISREIVSAHGGLIALASDAEGGTIFSVELPRNIPASATATRSDL